MVIDDYNIDVKDVTNQSLEKLNAFCETLDLPNLVKGCTCYCRSHLEIWY